MANTEPIGVKYHLSTEGYYFKYRPDKNNPDIKRATLYREKDNERVDDVRVSPHELEERKTDLTHHQVINHFEARLTLNTCQYSK